MVKVATLQHVLMLEDKINKLLNRQELVNMSHFDAIEAEIEELRQYKDKILAMVANMLQIIQNDEAADAEKVAKLASEIDAVNKEFAKVVDPQVDTGGSTGNLPD
jgi:hypothetical protein